MDLSRQSSCRIDWVDWMKAIGMYLIILGHFYSVGEKFIYVFHVPLFFVISGFLTKKESDERVFWRKLWYNLVIPMLLMAVANFVYHSILQLFMGAFSFVDCYWFVRNTVFGMVSGFDMLWFVYTLIVLKIFYQYCLSTKLFYSLIPVMLVLAYIYHNVGHSTTLFILNEPNSFINICTAYPFFALGLMSRDYKNMLNGLSNKIKLISFVACGLLLIALCGTYNGYVGMYCADYGGNIFLFLLGAVAGTVMIWAISKLLGNAPKAIVVISRGTFVILGFHKMLIDLVRAFLSPSFLDIVFAMLIILLFIPIILTIEKYLPLMAGKYRVKLSNS